MDILIITVLIIAAVILFLVELFVIPGISLAGISALACILYANYYAFDTLGPIAGFITLIASVLSCIAIIIWFMHSKTMDKLSLKKTLDYKIDPLKGTHIRQNQNAFSLVDPAHGFHCSFRHLNRRILIPYPLLPHD